jgi:hypothetical protein
MRGQRSGYVRWGLIGRTAEPWSVALRIETRGPARRVGPAHGLCPCCGVGQPLMLAPFSQALSLQVLPG